MINKCIGNYYYYISLFCSFVTGLVLGWFRYVICAWCSRTQPIPSLEIRVFVGMLDELNPKKPGLVIINRDEKIIWNLCVSKL